MAYLFIALAVLLLALFLVWQNHSLGVTRMSYASPRFPEGLPGYRVLQVSDLHGKRFGKGQSRLLSRAAAEKPDVVLVTGDIVSRNDTDFSTALLCMKGLAVIAPTYFIPGNHEADQENYGRLRDGLRAAGVEVLENRAVSIASKNGAFTLIGVTDPLPRAEADKLPKKEAGRRRAKQTADILRRLRPADDGFRLLLCHRPELFEEAAAAGMDLTLSGHAHGGQVRLPGLPGLYAPGQGFLPRYTGGLYELDGRGMIVSRGLGGKKLVPRIFNRPELISIALAHNSADRKNS